MCGAWGPAGGDGRPLSRPGRTGSESAGVRQDVASAKWSQSGRRSHTLEERKAEGGEMFGKHLFGKV